MGRKIFILSGHLGTGRYGHALAEHYAQAARAAGGEVRIMHLSDLHFAAALSTGDFNTPQDLEPDLRTFQENLLWCDHWTSVYPLWWGGMPGPMKCLLDRTLLPGFAFKYRSGSSFPDRLLKGRTARVLLTSDTPGWYFRWVYGAGHLRTMRKQILEFIGFKRPDFTMVSPVRNSTPDQRARWLKMASTLGTADALKAAA